MRSLSILFMVLILGACNNNESSLNDTSKVLVRVGETAITEKTLQAYMVNLGISQPNKAQLDQALDDLIKQQSLVHQAKKEGLSLSDEQRLSIKLLEGQALAQLAVQAYLASHPVSDADIKAEYNRITRELKGVEYKVHHLLFKDEVEALKVLDAITAGENYLQLEADYLSAHAAVQNVGDIGWVNVRQVPEAFHAPLEKLQPKNVYDQVVISKFGAHVLYLEDKRKVPLPVFENVKEGIRKTLEQKSIERYKQLAQIKAKVVVVK